MTPADLLNASVPLAGLTVARGLAYGPDPRQALDIYRLARAPERMPVVVFLYGGAWRGGARGDYRFVAAALARAGALVVVPDYRVFPATRFPGFLADCAGAVAHARRVAADWGGDPARLFVMGHSAGAYNAAMLALDPRWLRAAGDSRDDLAGMIGLAGPYDFLPFLSDDIRAVFRVDGDPRQTQPINYVDGRNPPLLLLHGGADRTVYPRHAPVLAGRARAAGGVATARIYPGVGHVGIILGVTPLMRWRAPVLADVTAFLAPAIEPA